MRTIGFKAYETVGISQVNPRGVKRMSVSSARPAIWPVDAPVAGLKLHAVFRPADGVMDVKWEVGPGTGSLAAWDGETWKFHGLPNVAIRGDASRPLARAAMLETWGEDWESRPDSGRVQDDPFWQDFVRQVEELFPIADVMYQ